MNHLKPHPRIAFLLIAAICTFGAANSLSPENLDRAKAATVYLVVRTNTGYSQGSGFLFRKDSGTGYILTNAHVVAEEESPSKWVEVFFNSGTPEERNFRCEVIGFDSVNDLAVIKVVSSNLPEPIVIPDQMDLPVTTPVYIFGFPFGEELAFAAKRPAITIGRGTVSSIREKDGQTQIIQIDGDLNPGNSGGPVVDDKGQLVGMSVAKVSRTQIGFIIPAELISRLLRGRILKWDANAVEGNGRKVTLRPQVTLFDPFQDTVSVVLFIIPDEATTISPDHETTQDERAQATKKMDAHTLLVRGDPVEETVEIPLEQLRGDKAYFVCIVAVTDNNGNIEYTPPTSVEVNLSTSSATSSTIPADSSPFNASTSAETPPTTRFDIVGLESLNITPPDLKLVTDYKVPSTIYDVVPGGWGRFLVLHLKDINKLAIFDVNQARITQYISVDSDNLTFGAGATHLFVIMRDRNLLLSYNLLTGALESSKKLPISGIVKNIFMGTGVRNTALISWSDGTEQSSMMNFCFFDVTSNQLKTCLKDQLHFSFFRDDTHIRPSADGSSYGIWKTHCSPTGLRVLFKEGAGFKTGYQHDSVGSVLPGLDGEFFYTGQGIYTKQLYLVFQEIGSYNQLIPDSTSRNFMGVRWKHSAEATTLDSLDFFIQGKTVPFFTMPFGYLDILGPRLIPDDAFSDGEKKSSDFTVDKRFHYISKANLIIVVPVTNDRLVLIPFNPTTAVRDSGQDFLLVTSQPTTQVKRGDHYLYRIQADSSRGDVKYSLESAPEGMEISRQGVVEWDVPENWDGPVSEFVIVSITDKSGQIIYHNFEIRIE